MPHPLPRRIGAWSLQAVVAAAFFAAGAMKLAAVPSEVQLFAQIGLGQRFRVVTGLVQIVGAFALVYPGLASIGCLWLGFTMFCSVVANVVVVHTSPAPAIVLMLLNALIVYLRRGELASLARTLLGRANSPTTEERTNTHKARMKFLLTQCLSSRRLGARSLRPAEWVQQSIAPHQFSSTHVWSGSKASQPKSAENSHEKHHA